MGKEIEELYLEEQKQNEIDHQKPTAGAMTNHILANLRTMSTKLQQFEWYIKGATYFMDRQWLHEMNQEIDQFFNQLGHELVNVGEKPSSTTTEFTEYGMLKEDERYKYLNASEMFEEIVADIQTSKLFISRVIVLAQNETKGSLQNFLIRLEGQLNQYSKAAQARLGKFPLEGLEEDEDDD